ncbi:MAG: hypothetical protein ACLUNV_08505 [Sutterella wadsworthensis]
MQKAAASLQPILDQQVGGCRGITREETESFITGFLMHQRAAAARPLTSRSIPGLEDFIGVVKTGNDYLHFNRSRVLPTYGKNFRPPAPHHAHALEPEPQVVRVLRRRSDFREA